MPKAGTQQTMTRQWEILRMIPSKGPGVTTKELTERLKTLCYVVTKRTVERDLQELSLQFALVCNDKSKPFGWRWADGASIDLPTLTLSEALSIHVIEEQVKPLLPKAVLQVLEPRFALARQKLNVLGESNKTARWRDKVRTRIPTMPLLPPQVDPEVLDRVQEAVLGEMQMVANYQRIAVDEPREMLLHPLGMVQRGAVSYLVATAFNYQDIRLYALHRIKQVELREDGATIPPGFNLDKYVNDGALEFGDSQKMVLTLRVHHQVLNYLKETPLSTDMTIVDDGDWAEVTASVTDSWQLRWWLLSQGAGVVVLSPLALRQEIACEVMATAKLYGDLDV